MKNLTLAILVSLCVAAPGFCALRVVAMPEPAMAGELAVAAVGFAGLVFLLRKKKK
jgi:hypothetical protein